MTAPVLARQNPQQSIEGLTGYRRCVEQYRLTGVSFDTTVLIASTATRPTFERQSASVVITLRRHLHYFQRRVGQKRNMRCALDAHLRVNITDGTHVCNIWLLTTSDVNL